VPLFELAFLPLALWRKTRLLAAGMGLLFHGSTQVFFFIPFVSLWACYVVLLPWGLLRRRAVEGAPRARASVPTTRIGVPRAALPALAVGMPLLSLAILQGLRGQTQAWPVACYPTFASLTADSLPDLLIEAESPDGKRVRLTGREHGPRSQAEWGRIFRISGAYGGPPDAAALHEYAVGTAKRAGLSLAPSSTLRVFRASYATTPELWDRAPQNTLLLSTFRVD
jgi:hypothetical protein